MNEIGEFEPGLMATERNDQEALGGIQQVSNVRSTHKDDGSLVSPTLAMSLEQIALKAQALPAERRKRLRQLKAAIDAGRYYVSSNDLAECLMTSMLLD